MFLLYAILKYCAKLVSQVTVYLKNTLGIEIRIRLLNVYLHARETLGSRIFIDYPGDERFLHSTLRHGAQVNSRRINFRVPFISYSDHDRPLY